MINADQILKLVNDYLVQLPYDRRPASLYEPIRYVLYGRKAHTPSAYAPFV